MKIIYNLFIFLSVVSCNQNNKKDAVRDTNEKIEFKKNKVIDITALIGTWYAFEVIDSVNIIYNYPDFIDNDIPHPIIYKLKKDSISVLYNDFKSGFLAIDSVWMDKNEYYIITENRNGFSFKFIDEKKRIGVWSQLSSRYNYSKSYSYNCIDSLYNTYPIIDYHFEIEPI